MPAGLVDRPSRRGHRIIRDPETYDRIKSTLGTEQAAIVGWNSDSNTARALRARFWREGVRLRVVRLDDTQFAAWIERIPPPKD